MNKGVLLNNRYKLNDIIGIGGMAYVYDAYDNTLERNVAIKILKDDFAQTDDFLQKFKLEATSAASLNDENIVAIYDVGADIIDGKNVEYIVMEKIDGKTLKEVIEEQGPLDNDTIIDYAKQIALALQAAHKNGVVHRDIKPGNILITKDGKAKVTDFGIARVATQATITYTSSILGTVHYISPEQAKGQPTDSRSDLYSLGIVLYEMATGDVPFDAETPVIIAIKHIQEEPKLANEINTEIDENLAKIIQKLLSKNINERYASASELIKDLDNYKDVDIPIGKKETQRLDKSELGGMKSEYTTKRKAKTDTNEKKKRRTVPIILASLLVIVLIFGMYSLLNSYAKNRERENYAIVPNLKNYSEDNAIAKLEELSLKAEVGKRIYSGEIQDGHVIEQSVEANKEVKKGSIVKLTISKGTEMVEVPRVINFDQEVAKKDLKKIGLEITTVAEENSDKDKGIIIDQYPAPYTVVPKGSNVKITVSLGKEITKVTVPSVIGQEESVAIKTLNSRGLYPGQISQEYSDSRESTVISQSVDPNTEVDSGSTIDLVISKGPEPKEDGGAKNNGADLGGGLIDRPKDPTVEEDKVTKKKYVFRIEPPMEGEKQKEKFNVKIYNLVPEKALLIDKDFTKESLTDGKAVVTVEANSNSKFEILLDDKATNISYE